MTCTPSQTLPLLGIVAREMKMYACKNICTIMFIVALFIIAKKLEIPNFIKKWENILWCIHTIECSWIMKSNKLQIYKKDKSQKC